MDWKKNAGKLLLIILVTVVIFAAGSAVYNYGYHRGMATANYTDKNVPYFSDQDHTYEKYRGKVFGHGKDSQPRRFGPRGFSQGDFHGVSGVGGRFFRLPYLEIGAFLAVAAAFAWMFSFVFWGRPTAPNFSSQPEKSAKESKTKKK